MKKKLFLSAALAILCFLLVTGQASAGTDTTIKGTTATAAQNSLSVTNSADTSLFTVRNDGNVGVGNSSPSQKLAVAGSFGILEGGASPSSYTIFQGGNQAADLTYTLPVDSSNGFLRNTGGTLSWQTPSASAGGADTQIQFNDAGALGGDAGFVYNKTTDTAALGTLNLTNALGLIYGGTGATTQLGAANNILPSQAGNSGKFLSTNGTDASWASVSSGGAPADATYITQTANATLTNEQALGSLATGLLKNTATTGVLSIASAGTDYENPLTFNSPLSRSVNTVSLGTLGIVNGGTGATSAAAARTSLGAAASGANSDITSLSSLSTALSIAQGGTNATTANAALNNLLPTQSGNSGKVLKTNGTDAAWNTETATPGGADTQVQFNDAGSLGGDAGLVYNKTTDTATIGTLNLTNALGTAYGGTGATSAAAARTSLGAAASGANSDITSLSSLSTALSIAQGGTNATTASGAANNILPSQSGNSGKFLTTNGTDSSWATVSATETDGVIGNEVTDAANASLTRSGAGTGVDPYKLAINLGNTNTWTVQQNFDTLRVGASGSAMSTILHGLVSVNPPAINNNAAITFTVTISGAATGDTVFLNPPGGIENIIYQGSSVTAANTVSIDMANESGSNLSDAATAARNWSYLIIKP